ncbi:MAG TPA: serine protease [Stellaceae bacterium]|nr:serine protease [Stellaceae bacterium]
MRHWAFGTALLCLSACGQTAPSGVEATPPTAPSQALATIDTAGPNIELASTGFFVDGNGHVLTAGHAVNGCTNIYVEKENRTVRATFVARSDTADLALIKIGETLGLPAVFARSDEVGEKDMVFAANYATLGDILAHGGALSNAVVADSGSEPGETDITLVSDATYGASGAPVLSSRGLVIGVVTRRGAEDRVYAVKSDVAKAFLAAHNIAFEAVDEPQLGALQDRAARARTVSAHVLCFKGHHRPP